MESSRICVMKGDLMFQISPRICTWASYGQEKSLVNHAGDLEDKVNCVGDLKDRVAELENGLICFADSYTK